MKVGDDMGGGGKFKTISKKIAKYMVWLDKLQMHGYELRWMLLQSKNVKKYFSRVNHTKNEMWG